MTDSMKNIPATIVGNGVSRKPINLEKLVDKTVIFGCNALYRDFHAWNYLVAIDDGMIDEVRRYHSNKGMLIIPDEFDRWEHPAFGLSRGTSLRRRSNAGMNAMTEAINRHHQILYCLGFDFILADESISTNNIYKDTNNYGPETHANLSDNQHRVKYLEWFTNWHSKTTFIFIIPENSKVFGDYPSNVKFMTVPTFISKVEN